MPTFVTEALILALQYVMHDIIYTDIVYSHTTKEW